LNINPTQLKGVDRRRFSQTILVVWLKLDMPKIVIETVFPVGDGGNEFDEKFSNVIGANNHSRTNFTNLGTDCWIKINQPNLTSLRREIS
jgi:hypothetical protein